MTIILITHIILMIFSFLATVGTAFFALLGIRISSRILSANAYVTGSGIFLGVILLLQHPIDSKCLVLATYTLAFAAINGYSLKRNQAAVTSDS